MGDATRMRVIKLGTDDTISEVMIRTDDLGFAEDTVGRDNLVEFVRAKGLLPLSALVGVQISFIVDEAGALKKLPINGLATVLYDAPYYVHGDAWLLAEPWVDGERDVAGLPDEITPQVVQEYFGLGITGG